jgi:hypothetical protein
MSEIFWVVGGGSGAGKTTVAQCTIEALNRLGRSTIAFKPVSAVNLFHGVDTLESLEPGRFHSSDAVKLGGICSAISQEQAAELPEVINPNRVMFLHSISNSFLFRTGARQLAVERLLRVRNPGDILNRPEVRDLFERKGLWDKISSEAPIEYSILGWHRSFSEVTTEAWDYLGRFGANATVCEGASFYLPAWQGHPPPTCIIVVYGGWVDIHVGINPAVMKLQDNDSAPRIHELSAMGSSLSRQSHREHLPVVAESKRNAAVGAVVDRLLQQAGIR